MHISGLALVAALGARAAEPPDVAQIMARVGVNQQQARDARASYVYRQEQWLRMRRSNGKLAREERREYLVVAAAGSSEKRLTQFAGRYQAKGRYASYDQPGYHGKGADIDGDLIQGMAEDMMNDRKSRDGIGHDLFPLTTAEQSKYDFRLVGTEIYCGRPAYRVAFWPRPDVRDDDQASWKGEALIDAEEFQPVSIETSLAEEVPLLIKVLLGTDIKGLGFSVTYQRFQDGVRFPAGYGGEFEVRGLFFYRRTISVSMRNTDFRKTDVNSMAVY